MSTAVPDLPTDVAALRAMVLAHAAELAQFRSARQAQDVELAAARAGIVEQRFEIEALKARLAKLLRMTFGRSSEKLRDRIEQLELTLAHIDEPLAEAPGPEAATGTAPEADASADARKPARRPLPEALPRDVVEHVTPCACPGCGGGLRPRAAAAGRGHDRNSGIRAGLVPRHPPRAPEAVLPSMRDHCPGAGTKPADPLRPRRRRPAGARARGQILRPPPAAPPSRDVRPREGRPKSLDAGGHGRPHGPLGAAAGRRTGQARHGRRSRACRRHDGAGAGAGARSHQDRAIVDVLVR